MNEAWLPRNVNTRKKWPVFSSFILWFWLWKFSKKIFQIYNFLFELWKKCQFCHLFFKKMSFFFDFLEKNWIFSIKISIHQGPWAFSYQFFLLLFCHKNWFSEGSLQIQMYGNFLRRCFTIVTAFFSSKFCIYWRKVNLGDQSKFLRLSKCTQNFEKNNSILQDGNRKIRPQKMENKTQN